MGAARSHAARDEAPLVAALRAALGGDSVRGSAAIRHAMANDASHFLLVPEVVVVAGDTAAVARTLAVAAAHAVPVTFRSGGTSLSGQGVTAGVLLDTRRSFRRIDVLDDGARVRVQPGATVRQVNTRLARLRRKLGPDPASEIACTIGGVVANNSSGMACGTEQNTYRTLESMTFVLPSGTVVDTAAPDADARLRELEPRLCSVLAELRDRVRGHAASVERIRQLFAMKNTMGYGVNAFLDFDSPVEILEHLMIGSEGTLGFVAEAVFRTVPVHGHATTGLLVFRDVVAAAQALPALVATGPAALELMDATSLRVGQRDPGAHPLVAGLRVDSHAALLVEYQAADAETLGTAVDSARRVIEELPLEVPGVLSNDPAGRAALWHLRKGLYAAVAGARPSGTTALLEDVVVPVAALAETCERLAELFDRHGYVDCVIFGHAKDGNIHFMLTDRFDEPAPRQRFASFTEDLVELVLSRGGSLKAEHGTGRVMAPFVRRQYGEELYAVMTEVKRACDPAGVLSPGVLLTEDREAHLRDLKTTAPVGPEVDRCVECGYCEPACPSKDLTLTPRQRIVLRRRITLADAAGEVALARELRDAYVYEGDQTCAVDGMCQTACPVLINTGDLVRRLRRESRGPVAAAGWAAAARRWGAVTSAAAVALDVAASAPPALVQVPNRLARAVAGGESVPLWSPDLPRGGTPRSHSPLARRSAAGEVTNPEAVYLPSCQSAMFGPADGGPGLQRSFEELCEAAGVRVVVPTGIDALCCGTPWSSKGFAAGKATMAARVADALRVATRDGELPVVCDASSCTEGLTDVLRSSTTTLPLRVVDAVDFLATRVLPTLEQTRVWSRSASLTVHPTCSSTRLGSTAGLLALAAAVSDDVRVPVDWGCCAFAGDRGMLHPELTASATAREAQEVRELGSVQHASSNRACEIGMSRATGETYEGIIEHLARAVRGAASPGGFAGGAGREE